MQDQIGNGPLSLDEDHRAKLDLLKDHFHGVLGVLKILRDGYGYLPDNFCSRRLSDAIDELYADVEARKV